jgi:RND superfamily putative drug exporter
VDRLRWLVIIFWAATLGLLLWLTPPFGAGGDEITSIIPVDNPAIQAEYRAVQEFGYPLTSRMLVVQRDPRGLSPFTEAASVLEAVSVDRSPQPYPLLGALPVTNSIPLVAGARERGTTLLTYLFMTPSASLSSQYAAARQYVRTHLDHPGDAVVGIAGSVPASSCWSGSTSGPWWRP